MKKRFLSVMLTISMLMSFVPSVAFAVDEANAELMVEEITVTTGSGAYGDNLTWVLDESGILTISGEGEMSNLSSAEDAPWHSLRGAIKGVVIESGVTTVEGKAFANCINLENVSMPDTITTIDAYAFDSCTSLKSFTIPGSVTTLGSNILVNSGIETLVISEGVTKTGMLTFNGCPSLKTVELPETLKSISKGAFSNCSSLESITIPKNVTTMQSNVFLGCSALKSVEILGSVASIENYMFQDCTSLTTVKLSNELTKIGDYAFQNCSSLAEITIPKTVTKIGNYVFDGCEKLSTVIIEEESVLASIGTAAFRNCSSLRSIVIPNTATTLGNDLFYNCSSLESVTLSSGIKSIPSNMFFNCGSLRSLTIPSGVTEIGDSAFYDCVSLETVEIPEGVTEIKARSFYNCGSLNNVILPSTLKQINEYTFSNCTMLKELTVPANVIYIGPYTFNGCINLTKIDVEAENTYYASVDGVLFNIDKTTLIVYPAGNKAESYTVPNGVTNINEYAFYKCSNLKSVTIPESLMSMADNTFYNCLALEEINVSENNTSYTSQDGALFDKEMTTLITYLSTNMRDSYTIPSGVVTIKAKAFEKCENLKSITIPSSVTSLEYNSIYDCANLEEINIDANNKAYCAEDGVIFNKDKTSLIVYLISNNRESYTVPSGVLSIGQRAFAKCADLKEIILPEGLEIIDAYAFYECTNISSIEFPESVTEIKNYAFAYSSLINVILPSNVKTLGTAVFRQCDSLTSATINEGVTVLNSYVFSSCDNLIEIKIPKSVVSVQSSSFEETNNLKDVYYAGTEAEWRKVKIGLSDVCLSNATIHYTEEEDIVPTETSTPEPSETIAPTETPTSEPSETIAPTETSTPKPSETVTPSETPTPKPSETITPSETPTPVPTETVAPSETSTPESSEMDKAALKETIENAIVLYNTSAEILYTEESLNTLKDAIENAKSVYEDEKSAESDVNSVISTLADAEKGLVKLYVVSAYKNNCDYPISMITPRPFGIADGEAIPTFTPVPTEIIDLEPSGTPVPGVEDRTEVVYIKGIADTIDLAKGKTDLYKVNSENLEIIISYGVGGNDFGRTTRKGKIVRVDGDKIVFVAENVAVLPFEDYELVIKEGENIYTDITEKGAEEFSVIKTYTNLFKITVPESIFETDATKIDAVEEKQGTNEQFVFGLSDKSGWVDNGDGTYSKVMTNNSIPAVVSDGSDEKNRALTLTIDGTIGENYGYIKNGEFISFADGIVSDEGMWGHKSLEEATGTPTVSYSDIVILDRESAEKILAEKVFADYVTPIEKAVGVVYAEAGETVKFNVEVPIAKTKVYSVTAKCGEEDVALISNVDLHTFTMPSGNVLINVKKGPDPVIENVSFSKQINVCGFKVSLANITENCTMVAVIYDKNNAISGIEVVDVSAGDAEKSVTVNAENMWWAKVFLWSDLQNMIPLCDFVVQSVR